MTGFRLSLTGHVTQADKERSDYLYVPFDLPAPAGRLHVRYRYSAPISAARRESGNVIDIGLFDPRGAEFPGGAGFRGWSGSNRAEFTIALTEATPGYLPGPLPAGRYQVVLGLYRIWTHGADYQLEIEADFDSAQGADEPGAAGDVPFSAGPPLPGTASTSIGEEEPRRLLWLRGDLQSHTEHSDAWCTVAELAAKAQALGLDFLAVTDHNTISHHAALNGVMAGDFLLIPGQEATTYYGHMSIWGTERWCDFRCRSNEEMAAVIDLAHAAGGLCSINHPKTYGPEWEYSAGLPVDAMEVWQGPWPWKNDESLALWDRLLAGGRRLPAVGGSDYHCTTGAEAGFLRLGQPTTWVAVAERSVAAILDAIRAGRASVSAFPEGPRLDLRAIAPGTEAGMGGELAVLPGAAASFEVLVEGGAGQTLRLVADGTVAHETLVTEPHQTVRVTLAAHRYVRAELVADCPPALLPSDAPADLDLRGWRWALSNPIYIRL